MTVTAEKVGAIMPQARAGWPAALAKAMNDAGITGGDNAAMFLAQLAHESSGLTRFEEGLNYSAQRLVAVFPRRFPTLGDAQPYARNPMALANKVYANRMGNGPPESGDGYKFRGRGPIQLTGRQNYTRCSRAIGVDLIAFPDVIVIDQVVGSAVACWFWNSNGLPALAARGLFAETTKRINGGLIGQSDRERWLAIARGVL